MTRGVSTPRAAWVAGATDRGGIRVVYERSARGVVLVITVYPESE